METTDQDARFAQALQDEPRYTVAERIVAEAERRVGSPVGLYVPELGGTTLVRVNGDETLPAELPGPGGVGPELDGGALERLREAFDEAHPGAVVEPLWLIDRALAVLVAGASRGRGLRGLARAVAPVFELAAGYTDVVERARRERPSSAAAEVQLGLLAPRIARVDGGIVVGSVLPAYDVGGDWFDHADNPEGTWLSIADAMGKGAGAAAVAALAVGSLRSARRRGAQVAECCADVHAAVWTFDPDVFITALISLWHRPTRTLTWANCGHFPPLLLRDGVVTALEGEATYPLGVLHEEREFPVNRSELRPGDRLLLFSDGITERTLRGGGRFGEERLAALLRDTAPLPAAAAVASIERAVLEGHDEPVRDDATQLLLEVDGPQAPG